MIKKSLILLIRCYQSALSPIFFFLNVRCRFNPSCSHYAEQAIEQHGGARGCWLALKRVVKCHPLSAGGNDPVPQTKNIIVEGKTVDG